MKVQLSKVRRDWQDGCGDLKSAWVSIDGVEQGRVSRQGDEWVFAPATLKDKLDAVQAGLDADDVLHNAFIDFTEGQRAAKRIQSASKSETLFRKPGKQYAANQWDVYPGKFSADVKALLERIYGTELEFLNKL